MTKIERLIAINKLSKKNTKWIHKDIFRILNKNEIWVAAYEKIKGNKGGLTPGSTPQTMDGMSLKKLKRLQKEVCNEAYKFPTPNDKIVQEVVRMILEAIYEPIFLKNSFGFQTGLGCHDALNYVEKKFRWVDYVVEKEIEQAYPTIGHHKLIEILQKRISDPRFINLVWKLLRCGALEGWSKLGVPQRSIVSPIFANIYYHELDEYIQQIKVNFESSTTNRRLKDKKIRLEYVRYADDWMVGIAGDRKLAIFLKSQITDFMRENLVQVKTRITNLRKGNMEFLGYEIFLPRGYKGKGRRGQPKLRFDLPVNKITKRYIERGYFKKLPKGVRPISRASYTVLEDHVIVSHYRKIWFGLLNYYTGCTNRGRLQYIHYLFHISCAMTLGHRHRTSCSKIFRKHGKTLKVKIPHTDKTESFPYKTSWKLSERKWMKGSHHCASLVTVLSCAIYDSDFGTLKPTVQKLSS